jgi:hypothetical protein
MTENARAIYNRPHHHKTFEYSQGNSQLKYLCQRMVDLEISSTFITFSNRSMCRLKKFLAPPVSDSDMRVENFLENAQKFYDIGARFLNSNHVHLEVSVHQEVQHGEVLFRKPGPEQIFVIATITCYRIV